MSALVSNTGAINFVFDDDSAISGMDDATPKLNVRYNLNGQIVGSDYKGIAIVNGKKIYQK